MTDRPIIFSGPMVRALLAGRKTQTRRLAKFIEPRGEQFHVRSRGSGWFGPEARVAEVAPDYAPYAKGDRLYVREHWKGRARMDGYAPRQFTKDPGRVAYLADGEPRDCPLGEWKWGKHRQGMHMPRWASRLTLIVEDVRVERLQAITLGDICAEGLGTSIYDFRPVQRGFDAWIDLWSSLHDKPGQRWEDDPFVVALSFRVVRENIDRITV